MEQPQDSLRVKNYYMNLAMCSKISELIMQGYRVMCFDHHKP